MEVNVRLQHEYYSRLKGGHGVRDIIGAYTELKTTEEDKTKLATNKGYVDVSNWVGLPLRFSVQLWWYCGLFVF